MNVKTEEVIMNVIKKFLPVLLLIPVFTNAGPHSEWYNNPSEERPSITWPTLNIEAMKEFFAKPEVMGIGACALGIAVLYGMYKYLKKPASSHKNYSLNPDIKRITRFIPVKPASILSSQPNNTKQPHNTVTKESSQLLWDRQINDIGIYQYTVLQQQEPATCAMHALKNCLAAIFSDNNLLLSQENLNRFIKTWKNITILFRKQAALKQEVEKNLNQKLQKNLLSDEMYRYYQDCIRGIANAISSQAVDALLIGNEREYIESNGGIETRMRLAINQNTPSRTLRTELNLTIDETKKWLQDKLEEFMNLPDQEAGPDFHFTKDSIDQFFKKNIPAVDQTGEWLEVDEMNTIIGTIDSDFNGFKNLVTIFNQGETPDLYETATNFKKQWKNNEDCQHIFLYNTANANDYAANPGQSAPRGHWYTIIASKQEKNINSIFILDSLNRDRKNSEGVQEIINFLK